MSSKDIMVGDLVTVWTGGWDVNMRSKYNNRVGVVVSITKEHDKQVFCNVSFGEDILRTSPSRLRLLTQKNKSINIEE